MGRNSKIKTKKKNLSRTSKGVYINSKTLSEIEGEFVNTTKNKWMRETEERLRAVFLVAEKDAFMKLAALTVLGNKEKFGHGRKRLGDIVDFLLFQYSCIQSAHVSTDDITKLVEDETGIRIAMTDEESDVLLKYAMEENVERSNEAFKELIEKGRKNGRFSPDTKTKAKKKKEAV